MPKLKKKAINCQRVSVEDAAEEIGCDNDFLRQMMKKKEWDLGTVVPPVKAGGVYKYYIFRPKLDKFLGIEKREN